MKSNQILTDGCSEEDHSAEMARADLYQAAKNCIELLKMIKEGDEMEGWVYAKIVKAADYIESVYHYLEYQQDFHHTTHGTHGEISMEAADDNNNEKCWSGYRKVGLKKKGDKMVNDCRPIKKSK